MLFRREELDACHLVIPSATVPVAGFVDAGTPEVDISVFVMANDIKYGVTLVNTFNFFCRKLNFSIR
jgi:hypothetical protein